MRVENHTAAPLVVADDDGEAIDVLAPSAPPVPGPQPDVLIVVADSEHSQFMHRLDVVVPTTEAPDEGAVLRPAVTSSDLAAAADRVGSASGQGVDVGPNA